MPNVIRRIRREDIRGEIAKEGIYEATVEMVLMTTNEEISLNLSFLYTYRKQDAINMFLCKTQIAFFLYDNCYCMCNTNQGEPSKYILTHSQTINNNNNNRRPQNVLPPSACLPKRNLLNVCASVGRMGWI